MTTAVIAIARSAVGDGVLSLAGAALAASTLISLLLDSTFRWWWADAIAALLIAATLLREGWLISVAAN